MARARKITLAKRDAAYDAIVDALNDTSITLDSQLRVELERAQRALEDLTRYLR